MKAVRILHISDLHRGSSWTEETVGDHKDHSVSGSFAGSITASMETDFINAISQWQKDHGRIDSIICTGDLGNKGKADKIKEGVSFIRLVQNGLGISKENVLFCPGNHDADRSQSGDSLFKNYLDALHEFGYNDHLNDLTPFFINGIPFLVANTSLGASEKNLFIQKYNQLVSNLDDDDRRLFAEELKSMGLEYLDDCLDIPVVTNTQSDRIMQAISQDSSSFFVLLMHHSLIPCNSVEIRPYSSVIDAGRVLEKLMNSKKDILLLHGHIHFPSSYMLSKPKGYCFVSSIGVGSFNGSPGSTVNIIEIICSDTGDHGITMVYEYNKQINGLVFNKSFCIYGNSENNHFKDIIDMIPQDRGIRFDTLLTKIRCSERDLLRVVLSNESIFKIARNQSNSVSDWVIHRNY